jgi:hypothetical protein
MPSITDKILKGNTTVIGGVQVREPYDTERAFFKKHPKVGGMASSDNKIILNPFSNLSEQEKEAVAFNEAARVHMRTDKNLKPNFELTEEQHANLKGSFYEHAKEQDRKATIAARLLSGDPSGGVPTPEQSDFVRRLKGKMFPQVKIGDILDE